MKRPIKFRVWDKRQKAYLDAEAHFSNEVPITPDDWSRAYFKRAQFEADQKEVTLEQYTGMCDKNSTEIYEGDVVAWDTSIPPQPFGESPDPGESRTTLSVVTFHNGRFGCDIHEGGFGDISLEQAIDEMGSPEIVGNFYENAELLK